MKPVREWIRIPRAYSQKLREACGVQVILEPSEVKPERFHVSLVPLPHPALVGENRVRLRLRASVNAELPPTDRGISDALESSLKLAYWFGQEQGGINLAEGVYATAFHRQIREDDEMFTDLAEPRSYSYDEHWLVEIEFDYEAAAEAVAGT
ncbi:MAG: hypothetical protein LBI86_09665 [Treponema sp.]|jgi:hypothetical protein|nr:hypothetical protein [Treponema sp.]